MASAALGCVVLNTTANTEKLLSTYSPKYWNLSIKPGRVIMNHHHSSTVEFEMCISKPIKRKQGCFANHAYQ